MVYYFTVKLFLTGATGLLGRNAVPILLERGHSIIALARKPEEAANAFPRHPNLRFVAGDLDQIEVAEPYLEGIDVVVHAAALFTDYYNHSATWEKFEKLNVTATLSLFRMAKRAGVQKGIFISSSGALADPHDALQDETTLTDLYRRSKVVGEKRLAGDAELAGFPIVTLRPGWIYGPEDPTPTITGRMVEELILKHKTAMVIGEEIPIVDARDVGMAIALAIDKVDRTTAYNIAGCEISAVDAIRQVSALIPGSKVEAAPLWLAMILGTVYQWRANLFGGINPMPVDGLKFVANRLEVNTQRSKDELGLMYRPFSETAQDVAAYWLKRCGKA